MPITFNAGCKLAWRNRFFPSAAAAEQAKFRPCLRCRPELAPGNAPIDAVSRTAKLAASRISAAIGMEDASLEEVAAELGIGSRHLRRVLRRALGVSPIKLAQTHRLLLAKQLLTETSLPITRVAFDSGFASVRRFNALFRSRYRLTPSDLRRSSPDRTLGESIRLTLSYRRPFAWNELLDFLAPRALTGAEAIVGRTYLRTVVLGELRGWLKVEPVANRHTLALDGTGHLQARRRHPDSLLDQAWSRRSRGSADRVRQQGGHEDRT